MALAVCNLVNGDTGSGAQQPTGDDLLVRLGRWISSSSFFNSPGAEVTGLLFVTPPLPPHALSEAEGCLAMWGVSTIPQLLDFGTGSQDFERLAAHNSLRDLVGGSLKKALGWV